METISFASALGKMLFALALVMALMMGGVYILKRILQGQRLGVSDDSRIKIIETKYLGTKNSIVLVHVLGKVMLLGVSPERLTHLATLEDQDITLKITDHPARVDHLDKWNWRGLLNRLGLLRGDR